MKPLNILHTVEFYAPHIGGAETVVQRISEGLASRGHRVGVATSKLPQREFLSLNDVEIIQFDISGNLAKGIRGDDIKRYLSFIDAFPADVMLNYAAQQWTSDLAFARVVQRKARPVNVIAPCGYSALSDPKTLDDIAYAAYYKDIIPSVLPKYDAAVYHSPNYKDFVYGQQRGFTNSVVIPNFVDENEFTAPNSIQFREKYGITSRYMLLSVGNFLPAKRHDVLIEIFRSMQRDDATLLLIGTDGGCLDKLKQQAQGLSVKFLTHVPRIDTVAAFRAADLFLFTSRIEASPLVIIEAKASRLPFVSTDSGNIRDFKGGIVSEEHKFAGHVERLLKDEMERRKLGQAGWDEWNERLTATAVISQYENLYYELLSRKAPRKIFSRAAA